MAEDYFRCLIKDNPAMDISFVDPDKIQQSCACQGFLLMRENHQSGFVEAVRFQIVVSDTAVWKVGMDKADKLILT